MLVDLVQLAVQNLAVIGLLTIAGLMALARVV